MLIFENEGNLQGRRKIDNGGGGGGEISKYSFLHWLISFKIDWNRYMNINEVSLTRKCIVLLFENEGTVFNDIK